MNKFRIRREESTVSKTLRFPKSLLDRASQVAHDNKISLNKLVLQSLEYALDNIANENEQD